MSISIPFPFGWLLNKKAVIIDVNMWQTIPKRGVVRQLRSREPFTFGGHQPLPYTRYPERLKLEWSNFACI